MTNPRVAYPPRYEPLPPEVQRMYAQYPEYRAEAEREAKEKWDWLRTGLLTLSSLAGTVTVLLLIKKELSQSMRSSEKAAEAAEKMSRKKDEKINKADVRQFYMNLRSAQMFMKSAERDIDKIRDHTLYRKLLGRITSVSGDLDTAEAHFKAYLDSLDEAHLNKAIDILDLVTERELPSMIEEYDMFEKIYQSIIKAKKAQTTSRLRKWSELEKLGEKYTVPRTIGEIGPRDTVGSLMRSLEFVGGMRQEEYALLPQNEKMNKALLKDKDKLDRTELNILDKLEHLPKNDPLTIVIHKYHDLWADIVRYGIDKNRYDRKIDRKIRANLMAEDSMMIKKEKLLVSGKRIPGQLTEFI